MARSVPIPSINFPCYCHCSDIRPSRSAEIKYQSNSVCHSPANISFNPPLYCTKCACIPLS